MRFVFLFLSLIPMVAGANTLSLDDALRATYSSCVGIDEELADLKKMAGINTAVTAVGTAAGLGATVVGLVKVSKDKKAEELEAMLREIDEMQAGQAPLTSEEFDVFLSEFNSVYDTNLESAKTIQDELDKTVRQSKNLGNWLTGLMAGATVTNVAGWCAWVGSKPRASRRRSLAWFFVW